jgi:hypothetical protein
MEIMGIDYLELGVMERWSNGVLPKNERPTANIEC